MRRARIIILLVLIVVVGLAVLYFALNQGGGGAATTASDAPSQKQVYYAAQSILQGTVITQEMLGTFSLPPENVAEVMFETGEEQNLVGQTARFTLEPGTLITSAMVGAAPPELAGPSWALQVTQGTVAVTIPASRYTTAAFGVGDGAKVNVIACMIFVDIDPSFQSVLPNFTSIVTGSGFLPESLPTLTVGIFTDENTARQGRVELDPTLQQPVYAVPSEPQRPRLVCQMILQDISVLKLGNFGQPTPAPAADPNAAPADPNAAPAPAQTTMDTITLLVSPQDSISLNYFVYSGAVLTMSLRNPNDNSRIDAQSATLTSILTQYNISLPSKLPYAQQPQLDFINVPSIPSQ